MRLTTIICGGILTSMAGTAIACDLPKLAVIPPKDKVAGNELLLRASASAYFTAIQAYTTCVQAELAAAGGDAAPEIVKRVLVTRNNTAVAEAEFMMKLFTENVGATPADGPPVPAAPPASR